MLISTPPSDSSPMQMGGEPAATPNTSAPTGSPASTPVIAAGLNEAAKAQIGIASKLLMQVLPHLTDTTEQNEVLGVISRLNKKFGSQKSGDLEDAQLIKLLRENSANAQAGGMPPQTAMPPQGAGAANPYGG